MLTLAGSFPAITTFTFSTMMAVVTTYALNYTPRVVENFLASGIAMRATGLFVGGFLYAVVSFFLLKDSVNSKYVVSATVAIVYSLAGIGHFIKFVFFVSNQIQNVNPIKQTRSKSGRRHRSLRRRTQETCARRKNRLFQLFALVFENVIGHYSHPSEKRIIKALMKELHSI